MWNLKARENKDKNQPIKFRLIIKALKLVLIRVTIIARMTLMS